VVGAPRWKGTTADEDADPTPVGCTMTCDAVIVVPSVVPRTRTGAPVVTAVGEVELVPFWYVVEDASSTVTFCPADVVIVKPEVDMLLTVPAAPPEAGPDRAVDPPLPDPMPTAEPRPGTDCAAVAPGDVSVADEDVMRLTESPITEHTAAATIPALLRFDTSRRTLGQCGCSSAPAEVADSGGGVGGAAPLTDLPATGFSDASLDTRSAKGSLGSFDSYSFMVALLVEVSNESVPATVVRPLQARCGQPVTIPRPLFPLPRTWCGSG
jgi:hypothetical protein